MEHLLFTRVRKVKVPNRANHGDAGIDFYIPILTRDDLLAVGGNNQVNLDQFNQGLISFGNQGTEDLYLKLKPGARVLIPSGIKVLINPESSMLMAANKSGVATREGLVYTAEIVDSPYTGEMHIGILNTTPKEACIPLMWNKKIMQFVHVPVILSTPVEVTNDQYDKLAEGWGTRGENGFGSTDNK